jgi:hypothetical protein
MFCYNRRWFYSSFLLPFVISAQSIHFTNTSTSATTTTSACTSCTVTAHETFLAYPTPLSTVNVSLTITKVPHVTILADGSRETNYETVTQSSDVTGTFLGTGSIDPFATLTWEVDGVKLTYPTTYVSMFGFSGGLFTATTNTSGAFCSPNVENLNLPANSATGVIAPVPDTVSINLQSPTAISAPAPIIQYLNGIPAVQTQFSSTNLASCSWTKIVGPTTQPHLTATVVPTTPISGPPVQKVSVTILTEVTANQVVITAPGNTPTTIATGGGPVITNSPALVHVENPDTALNTPTPGQTTAEAVHNTAAASSPNIAGAIISVLLPSGSGNNGGSGSGSGGTNGGAGTNGGTATTGINGGSPATGVSIIPLPDTNGGTGSGSNTPSSLVVTLGGKATTILPTVIPGSQGSVTAFILAPGSTLIAGGTAITLSDTTLSLPGPSKTGSGKGSNSASSTITSTGGVGGAIASGLGYTAPVSTGQAGRVFIHDSLLLVIGLLAGSFGWLAIYL